MSGMSPLPISARPQHETIANMDSVTVEKQSVSSSHLHSLEASGMNCDRIAHQCYTLESLRSEFRKLFRNGHSRSRNFTMAD
jgi:hypothetical protein